MIYPQADEHLLALLDARPVAPTPAPRSIKERLLARGAASTSGAGYAETALARECAAVRAAPNGERNHALNRAAFSVFQLVQKGELDHATASGELLMAADAVGLTTFEAQRTLASAWEGAERTPRPANRLPERLAEKGHLPKDSKSAIQASQEPAPEPYEAFSGLFLTTTEMCLLQPPEWLVDGVLVTDSLAMVYGAPGTMKSFLAIDWALSISKGAWWNGRELIQGPVIYCIAEGQAGASVRVEAWMEHNKVYEKPDHLLWYPYNGELLNQGWVDMLAKKVTETQPVLVVVDTLSRSMPGGDENDSVDMTRVVASMDQIRQVNGACVLAVHHSRKDGGSARGHSSLFGAVNTSIETKKNDRTLTVRCEKQKDAAPFDDMTLWWKPVGQSIVLTSDRQGDDEEGLKDRAKKVLHAFHVYFKHTGAPITLLRDTVDMDDASLYEALNHLIDEKLVEQVGQKYRLKG